MATNNFLNMVGIMLASAALWLCRRRPRADADRIILRRSASLTLVASVYVLSVVPEFLVRFMLWLLTHTIYRIRIVGQAERPVARPGAARLQPRVARRRRAGRRVRPAVRPVPGLRPVLRALGAAPAAEADARDSGRRRPRGGRRARARARRSCEDGHVVCIFAEGAISRTGNLLPFKRGFEQIVDGLDVPIIPVYLDRVWGSIFSFKGGKFLWKWPARFPYPVTVAFGAPLPSTTTGGGSARWRCMELGREAAGDAPRPARRARPRSSSASAKRRWGSFCMADSHRPAADVRPRARRRAAAVALDPPPRARTSRTSACCCRRRSAARSRTSRRRSPARSPVNLNFTAGP